MVPKVGSAYICHIGTQLAFTWLSIHHSLFMGIRSKSITWGCQVPSLTNF